MKVIAIIPAHNEEQTIAKVLKGVNEYKKKGMIQKVLVVDDASTDRTGEIARSMGVDVVTHIINMGVGGAQRTGYRIAIEDGFDYIIQLDADGQHNPKHIKKFLQLAKKNPDIDMVIGSRFVNRSYKNYNMVRKLGIKFFTKVVRLLSPANITDVTSGYRLYKVSSLKKLGQITARHWAVEQTLEAARKGFNIKELSIKMPVRSNGRSQFNLETYIKYPIRMTRTILRVLIFR